MMLDLLILIPLAIDSATAARNDARNRVDTWDLKRICGTTSQWTAEDQRKLLDEMNTLPDGSMVVARLAPDWLRMRDGNRICRGEKVPLR